LAQEDGPKAVLKDHYTHFIVPAIIFLVAVLMSLDFERKIKGHISRTNSTFLARLSLLTPAHHNAASETGDPAEKKGWAHISF
jgi:hypothetical protein